MTDSGSTSAAISTTPSITATKPQPLILGLWQRGNERYELDAYCALHDARTDGYDYVTTIIPTIKDVAWNDDNSTYTNARNYTKQQIKIRTDLTSLPNQWWKTSVVGIVSTPTTRNTVDAATIATAAENHPIPMDTTEPSASTTTTCQKPTSSMARIVLDESFEQHVRSSLEWAIHMNLPAIVLPDVLSSITNTTNDYEDDDMIKRYCTILQRVIGGNSGSRGVHTSSHQQFWIPVPLSLLGLQKWVNITLSLCRSNNGLPIYALLIVPPNNNNNNNSNDTNRSTANYQINSMLALHAFIGSGYPIAAVQVNTNDFLINKKGFPTLSKFHQRILTMLLKRLGRMIRTLVVHDTVLTTTTTTTTANQKAIIPLLHYQQYLQHFRKTRTEIVNAIDTDYATNKEYDYLDQLQQPLQPLKDHLENNTYEVFEQDPVKYKQYQKAVQLYIEDFIFDQNNNPNNHHDNMMMKMNTNNNTITILVVGAGRGPLVSACCLAYRQVERTLRQQQQLHVLLPKIVLFAVEKNPSAVLYLHSMLHQSKHNPQHVWYDFDITIVHEDLRHLSTTKHTNNRTANVVVSELLGSFGCNELSPECLHDLLLNTNVCNQETISIPCHYTSYLAPVSSTKLHQQVCQQSLYPTPDSTSYIGYRQAVETPYVVRPHAASQMHIEVPCWSFEHGSIHHPHDPTTATTNTSNGNYATNNMNHNNASSPNHERSVQISFTDHEKYNPWYATSTGCGYNPPDVQMDTILHEMQQQQQQQQLQNKGSNHHNNQTRLPCWIMNGLLGTFTAILYTSRTKTNGNNETIQISTAPNYDFSMGMFSWFPLYFPLYEPILVPQHSTIQVTMERKCCPLTNRVWYEWSVQIVQQQHEQEQNNDDDDTNTNHASTQSLLYVSPIHNPGGRSYHVAM